MRFRGFTLLELLISIGVLITLLAVVLIAVNPFEQFSRASDVATQAVAKDFISSTKYYFTFHQSVPWQKDTSCRDELSFKKTLSDMPACAKELTDGGELQASVLSANEAKNVHVTECSGAVAVCYKPKSQQFHKNSDVKYSHNGVLQPSCPNGSDCYACSFSTSDAQECFQALSPNGTLAMGPTPKPGQPVPIEDRHSKKTCSEAVEGKVSCMAEQVTNSAGESLTSLAPPRGLGPTQLHTAYNLPCAPGGPVASICQTPTTFGPQTIAIVDAYHSPTLENDLAAYNQAYGLPPCTIANGCLKVVNQNGQTSPLPAVDPSWALEISLDVQMAHAICQTCKILLVEANTNNWIDIVLAVNRAAAMGVTAISNSYGSFEWAGQISMDPYYNHPGVFVTVSSGDAGHQMSYPSASSHVISVGGTRLSLFPDNTYASEVVWMGSGLGCSDYESALPFQKNLPNWMLTGCGSHRGAVDVSAVADPDTGVTVYYTYPGRSGWWIVGGTSVSSPIVAAALTMLGTPAANEHGGAFLYAHRDKFRDIVTPGEGELCGSAICMTGVGYDGPTGIGSPDFALTLTPTSAPTPTPTPQPSLSPWGHAAVFSGRFPAFNPPTYTAIFQLMNVPYNPKMSLQSDNLTVEAWIKPELPTSDGGEKYTIVNNIYTLTMYPRPNGEKVSYVYSLTIHINSSLGGCQDTGLSSGNAVDFTTMHTVPKSEFTKWKHVVGMIQNGRLSIYENGVWLKSYTPVGMSICNAEKDTIVGVDNRGVSAGRPNIFDFFRGEIDEVRISNIARYNQGTVNFTPPQLPFVSDEHTMMLYHFDTNSRDSSSNSLDGQLVGGIYYVPSTIPASVSTPPTPTPTRTPTPTPTRTPTPVPTSQPTVIPSPSPTPNGQPIVCGTGNFPADIPSHAGEMKAFLWKDEGSFLICRPQLFGPDYKLDVSFDPNFAPPAYGIPVTMPIYDGTRGDCCQTFLGLGTAHNTTWGIMYERFGELVRVSIDRPNSGGMGFIPAWKVWANYQCGKTLYWRLVDFYNRNLIKSATHADVISCENSPKMYYLDWYNIYFNTDTKKQRTYGAQWDGNSNGVMDELDYWWQSFRGKVSTLQ